MGVQLLDGDWTVAADGDAAGKGTRAISSGRHQRWTAFRSWYRGGRVFDRAHEALIAAAIMHPLPSPASQGRPLTPCLVPTDRTPPVAPSMDNKCNSSAAPHESALPPGVQPLGEEAATRTVKGEAETVEPNKVAAAEVPIRVDSPLGTVVTAGPMVHVITLTAASASSSLPRKTGDKDHGTRKKGGLGTGGTTLLSSELGPSLEEDGPSVEGSVDDTSVDGLVGWMDDRVEEAPIGEVGAGGVPEKVPRLVVESGSEAAKRLRMEARRKFLAARTVDSKAAASKVGIHAACAERHTI